MLLLTAIVLLVTTFNSCTPGTTNLQINGSESSLPQELKGLKVYQVNTGGVGYVKVAVLNNSINSLTYPVGKSNISCIIINNKPISIKEVVYENDSIIVCKKQ